MLESTHISQYTSWLVALERSSGCMSYIMVILSTKEVKTTLRIDFPALRNQATTVKLQSWLYYRHNSVAQNCVPNTHRHIVSEHCASKDYEIKSFESLNQPTIGKHISTFMII